MRKHRMVLTYNTVGCYNKSTTMEKTRKMKKCTNTLLIFFLIITILFTASCKGKEDDLEETYAVPQVYILNVNSKKIHKVTCGTATLILEKNKREYKGDISMLYYKGYTTCGNCFR